MVFEFSVYIQKIYYVNNSLSIIMEDPINLDQSIMNWLEDIESEIPGSQKLLKNIRHGETPGHIIHAEFLKLIYNTKKYKITAVEKNYEKNGKSFDVDIELDNSINIQVWYATGLLNNFIINQEDSKTQTKYRDKLKLTEHVSLVSEYGGTHHSWENQQKEIMKKVNQLPNDKLGIVWLINQSLEYAILPDFLDHVSKNKCVVCIGGPYLNDMKDGEHNKKYIEMINSVGTIFCSDEFDHLGVVKKLITDLGHRYGDKNIMPSASVYFGKIQ